MNNDRMVWRERHVFPAEEIRYRNPMFPKSHKQLSWPRIVTAFIIVACFTAAAWFFCFGTPFRITYVTVDGNHFLRYDAINGYMQQELHKRFLLIFPRDSFVFFSTSSAKSFLENKLHDQRAIESLTVKKQFPSLIAISLKERIPNAVYINGGKSFLIDRDGIIVAPVEEGKKTDQSFPTLYDQTTRDIQIGELSVHPDLINFLFSVQQLLKESTDVSVESFYIPNLTCPEPIEASSTVDDFLKEQALRTMQTNADVNSEEGSDSTQSNTNTSTPRYNNNAQSNSNAPSNDLLNVSDNIINTNTNQGRGDGEQSASDLIRPCDLNEQVKKNLELHIKTSEKWQLYLRIDDSADAQIQRLSTLLKTQKPDRAQLHYIDLRFGEQVNYR